MAQPAEVIDDLCAVGKKAFYEAETLAIVERIGELSAPGDKVVVFSNGGFDNIHVKLLDRLGAGS